MVNFPQTFAAQLTDDGPQHAVGNVALIQEVVSSVHGEDCLMRCCLVDRDAATEIVTHSHHVQTRPSSGTPRVADADHRGE